MLVQGRVLRQGSLMPPCSKMRARTGGSHLMRILLFSHLCGFVLCWFERRLDKVINGLAEFPCVQVADAEALPALVTRNGTSAVCFNGPTDKWVTILCLHFLLAQQA